MGSLTLFLLAGCDFVSPTKEDDTGDTGSATTDNTRSDSHGSATDSDSGTRMESGYDTDTGTTRVPRDDDGDGYTDTTDCDDTRPWVNPGAVESQYTVWDDDCSGDAYVGLTFASTEGDIVATTESVIGLVDATFEAGTSGSWTVISDYLGMTASDLRVSDAAFDTTLGDTFPGLEFFGTGGAATVTGECLVLPSLSVAADMAVAVVFNVDNETTMRYGLSVFVGDSADSSTWDEVLGSTSIVPDGDVQYVGIATLPMAGADLIVCAGGVEYDATVHITHVAVFLYE